MKALAALFTLLSLSAFAQRDRTIDDLDTIPLNLDAPATKSYIINYPNYRMGGGNGAGRRLNDCLMLDVRHSDAVVIFEEKLALAKMLKVQAGLNEDGEELAAVVKGENVVFYMPPMTLYMTFLRARARDGRTLNDVLREGLPPVREGNTVAAPTGLVYIRDCRF